MIPYLGLLLLALLATIVGTPRVWSATEDPLSTRAVPASWPFGGALWRAWVRGMAASGPLLLIMALLGLPVVLAAEDTERPEWFPWSRWLGLFGLGVFVVLELSLILWNRPRWMVPPRFRNDPGAIAEWRAAVRRRRAR